MTCKQTTKFSAKEIKRAIRSCTSNIAVALALFSAPAAVHAEDNPAPVVVASSPERPVIVQAAEDSQTSGSDEAAEQGAQESQQDGFDEHTSTDDLFRQVFGKDRPALGLSEYAVRIDTIFVGEYTLEPDKQGANGYIDADFLTSKLALVLSEPYRQQVIQLAAGREEIGFDEIRALGINVSFDNGQLALNINIPMTMRGVSDIYVRSIRQRDDYDYITQSDFSAFVSGQVGLTFVEDSAASDTGLYRIAGDLDVGINIHGIALQGEFRYDDRRARKWSRRDIRATYDDRDSLIRFELGDLTVGRRPFQLKPDMAGFAAYRKYPINPYFNIRPSVQQGFDLEQAARVEVIINGVPARSFDLREGRYNLRELPLVSSAANEIELRVQYASGRTETIIFPAFFDIELLRKGLFDFAFNAGVPYRDEDGIRHYDTGNHNISAYARYGVSDNLTIGMNWERDKDFDLVGADVAWAGPIGTFAINAATNVRQPSMASSQFTAQYRWRDTDPSRDLSIDGLLILTGKDYRTLNNIFSGNNVKLQTKARVGKKFGPNTRVQLYGGYDEYRAIGNEFNSGTNYYVGITCSQQLSFGSISASAEYQRNEERSGPVFRIGLSMPLGRGSLTSSYSTEDNAARVQYTRLASTGVNSFSLNGAVERRDGSDRQSLRVGYQGNRFEFNLNHTARDYFTSNASRDMRTDVSFGTALVFADGHFGLSRPVRNTFVIFDAEDAAGDYQLAVDPRTGFASSSTQYSAFSGALGPAVLTNLSPYFNRVIEVDAPGAPSGSSLGGQVYAFNPGYLSGHYVKVGTAYNVSVVGNMVDRDGRPLAFAAGEVTPLSPADAEDANYSTVLFTNRSGRFFIDGVKAGQSYLIHIEINGQTAETTINVPEELEGMFELNGPLRFNVAVPVLQNDE